jgi:glucose-6-phosphate dehydrogenase assembly protein OpcA
MSAAAQSVQRHTHASGLHAVADALDDLHRDALRAAGAESTQVRLSVLNIVAVCNDPSLVEAAVETVVTVSERHPARAIVIHADHDRPTFIESDISLRQSPVGSYIELVRLDVGGEPALHLTSIVQPLLIPDIPVHLWIVGSPPLDQAFRPDAVSVVDLIILDTAAYPDAHGTLQRIREEIETYGGGLCIGDIAWERLRPWRDALAHAFAGPAMRAWLHRIHGVDVVSAGTSAPFQALLLTGWLASRLHWRHDGGPDITGSEVPPHDAVAGELQHVRVRCSDGRHTARVDVERRGAMLRTSIKVDAGMVATSVTPAPWESDGLLIARVMAELEDDHVYRQAVSRASTVTLDD